MSFYVHLPSNSSLNYFPGNRSSSFRTKLATKLPLLEKDYEVALTEISYIHSISQFPEPSDQEIFIQLNDPLNNNPTSKLLSCVLGSKHYGDINQLIKAVKTSITEKIQVTNFISYNKERNRVIIDLNYPAVFEVTISKRLALVLGLNNTEIRGFQSGGGKYIAENPPDLLFGTRRLFVYTDIVVPQFVGNTFAPLLRSIPLKGEERQPVTVNPVRNYLNLNRRNIDDITLFLCNEFGEEVLFDNGLCEITLHFKLKDTPNGS